MKIKIVIPLALISVLITYPSLMASTPQIWVDKPILYTGTRVRIDGTGFPGSAEYQIFLDDINVANGTTYGGGSFYRTITLSRLIALGSHNITVISGAYSAMTNITVIQWPATLSVSPSSRRTGEEITICGEDYPPRAFYKVYLDEDEILSGATDDDGRFCRTYELPKTNPLGVQQITAKATKYTGPPSATQPITVLQWTPTISIKPDIPSPGATVTINGENFPPSCLYRILFDGEEVWVGTANPDGTFSMNYLLLPTTTIGSHTFVAEAVEYTGPPAAVLDVSVEQWSSSLRTDPEKPHPGGNVTFVGENFPPRTPFLLSFDGDAIASGNTTAGGSFSVLYTLPKNATLGIHTASAVATQYAGPPTATLQVDVVQWPLNLYLLPPDIHPGMVINLEGNEFPPDASYSIYLDSTLKILVGSTNSTGFMSGFYRLSNAIALGSHDLTIIVGGYTGPPETSLIFEVTEWPLTTSIQPDAPTPGSMFKVIGSDYPPGSAYYIKVDGSEVGRGIVGENGNFTANVLLPRETTIGLHTMSVESSFSGIDPVSLTLRVSKWPATISTDPTFGPQGTLIELRGAGYPSKVVVRIYWDDSYIKATQTIEDGSFISELITPENGPNAYHTLQAFAGGGYAGPPGAKVYFWLGSSPPQMTIQTCDEGGESKDFFFVDDGIYVKGGGYPPSIAMEAYLIPEGYPTKPAEALAHSTIWTNEVGTFTVSKVGEIDSPESLRLWLDVNSNGVFDASDLMGETFMVLSRPDMSIEDVEISTIKPTQGEVALVQVGIKNNGLVMGGGSLIVIYDGMQVASTFFEGIEPGMKRTVIVNWDTSSSDPGTGHLRAEILPLPGEINLVDNVMPIGQVTIIARPDISLDWLIPGSREVHKGATVRIRVMVRNSGPTSQTFGLSLYWGLEEILHRLVNLGGGRAQAYGFDWDTTSAIVGANTISARAEVLPFERNSLDNSLQNGSIRVTDPNRPPNVDSGGPYSGIVKETISFDGSFSFDIDGEIISHRWDFGDGSWAYGEKVDHAYLNPGTYNVTLLATDDDGDSATVMTKVIIRGGQRYKVTLVVYDSLKLTPIKGASVVVGGETHSTGQFPLQLELEEGILSVSIAKPGFQSLKDSFFLNKDSNLAYKLDPIFELFPCDAVGTPKADFGLKDDVYVSWSAPDSYAALLYIVADGGAMAGEGMLDVSTDGHEYILSKNGTVLMAVWRTANRPGAYDMVLDLDSNGVYDPIVDVLNGQIGPALTIPEQVLLGGMLATTLLIGLINGRKDRVEWESADSLDG